MAEVLLAHHALGLTDGIKALADQLRQAGHTVHTPDAYQGKVFTSLEEGLAYAQEAGFGEVRQRTITAAQELPAELVYVGVSLGVMAAQQLAQTRAGARGAVLLESCVPPSEFGDGWPKALPVQVHGMDEDPIFAKEGDIDFAREVVKQADDGQLFVYPGNVHLFVDSTLPTYDAEATALVVKRVLEFLARI